MQPSPATAHPYSRLDIWESLKAHVLDRAPALGARLAARPADGWKSVTVREAQLLAAMVALDLDPEIAALRRKGRALLAELDGEGDGANGAMVVAERRREFDGRISDAERERLRATAAWIAANPPAHVLAPMAGAHAAARAVSRGCAALKGVRAWRWLAAIGYPAPVPDGAKARFLVRMGWMAEPGQNAAGREEVARALEAFAHEAGASVAEMEEVLAAFTGSGATADRDAARCLPVPRCGECPVAEQCAHHRDSTRRPVRESRSLATSMREEQRPREKLAAKGAAALGDEELLAILIRTGNRTHNAVDLANQVLRRAESVDRLAAMSVAELSKFPGIGEVKAITIKAALELGRRFRAADGTAERPRIASARSAFETLRPRFVGAAKEEFVCLNLNVRLELIRVVPVSVGTLNQTLVHPRDAFSEAVRDSAHAVLFAHNHPSGDPTPSREDRAVTKRLLEAGKALGIEVLDHVIVGGDKFFSFAEAGELRLP